MSAPVLVVDPIVPESEHIKQAAEILLSGKIIILPTDTVYGIGVLASETSSPVSLFEIKHRCENKSIPLLIAHLDDLMRFSYDLPQYAMKLAAAHWPGALTLVVRASSKIPPQFVAADGSVALRIPAHTITLAVLDAVGAPIACSSANLSGKTPALSFSELDPELTAAVALVIDGGSVVSSAPSTVVSCLQAEPLVLRPGPVTL